MYLDSDNSGIKIPLIDRPTLFTGGHSLQYHTEDQALKHSGKDHATSNPICKSVMTTGPHIQAKRSMLAFKLARTFKLLTETSEGAKHHARWETRFSHF